jgi:hypothetical protein
MKFNYCLLISVIVLTLLFSLFSNKEGFNTYGQCRKSGYTKEFCVQTPTNLLGPSGCMCKNGMLGYVLPGSGGACSCSMPNYYPLYNPVYSPDSVEYL